ncbi:MAG: Eco57I restriction-modification methylase domain-containing protein [Candidatus Cloacimonetes bacterium]|nr:Eco57I restriction-modification methylase domain-containing protein [Candidatus Cloacimonadota bacterium]
MNEQQAINLIKNTFENTFDKLQFINFISNLLNLKQNEIINEHPYSGNYIPEAYRQYINSLYRIAKYEDDSEKKIDVLIVRLEKETSLERARSMQRNFIAWYLKGSRGGILKDAALVAFVSPDDEDWRFSFVKIQYVFEGNKVVEDKSPALRYSFLVGLNENSHTAKSRFIDLLMEDKKDPNISDIEEAFSVEKVTKEFYIQYRQLFIKLTNSLNKIIEDNEKVREEFNKQNIRSVDFTKKLIGQIVFLYFLQKKGWFGVNRDSDWGSGSKNFLRGLFEEKYSDYENFFNDILEPLFYEALAQKREDNYYSRFNCKIPFLNGGLFDPINSYNWIHTDILLPNELFSNNTKTKEDVGTGIFDVFDRFNFTVKEDEPLEKEVAVDPEMLGKIFEKLCGVNEKNFEEWVKAIKSKKKAIENKFNKKYGVYYTPREIVHYMCQQSLINYLSTELNGKAKKEDIETLIHTGEQVGENEEIALIKEQNIKAGRQKTSDYKLKIPESIRSNALLIDDKLSEITVCDPAVGSGAFPVGMMSEIVRVRNVLTTYIKDKAGRSIYNFKRHTIENSIYGVDIDIGAIEIAKLRFWLSLVVDEQDIHKIKPLPNLSYKIMQGNSLLEEFEGIKLFNDKLLNLKEDINKKRKQELKHKLSKVNSKIILFYQKDPKFIKYKKINRPIELYQLENEQQQILNELNSLNKQTKDNLGIDINFTDITSASNLGEQLKEMHKDFLNSYERDKKQDKLKEIQKIEWELIKATLKENGKQNLLPKIEKFRNVNFRPYFLWKLHFAEVFKNKGGFDIVIANPPYIKEYTDKHAFDGLRNSPYYQGKMDIWYFFACYFLDFLKEKTGILCFIATNNWVTNYGASIMRNKVIKETQILQLIDFNNYKIFISAGIQTMIMFFRNNEETDNYKFDYRKLRDNATEFSDVSDLLNRNYTDKNIVLKPIIRKSELLNKLLIFNNPKIEDILQKIRGKEYFKLTEKEIAQGIVPNPDVVNSRNIKKISNKKVNKYNIKIGEGVFVIKKDLLKNTKDFLKPLYEPKRIKRYYFNKKNDKVLIYIPRKINKNKIPSSILEHLEKYKEIMMDRRENKQGKIKFYDLHWSRSKEFFNNGEKVISLRKCVDSPSFSYVRDECYVMLSFNIIKTKRIDNKFLTGFLNTKLCAFWLRYKGKMQGNNFQIDKEPLLNIPIPKISEANQQPFIKIVDQILIDKKAGKDTQQLEDKIDLMVYKLYELTYEEAKIVDSQLDEVLAQFDLSKADYERMSLEELAEMVVE